MPACLAYTLLSACLHPSLTPPVAPLSTRPTPPLCSGVLDAAKELEKLGKREAEATGKVGAM